MGAGSLGTILGAYIAKAGRQVDLIDIYEAHVARLNKDGATVTGRVEFNVPLSARTPQKMEGIYDLIFFMVKQTYNDSAIEAIKPHINEKTIICTLQNGLPEYALAEKFGGDRVFGCVVGWGATFKGPGVSEMTSDPDIMSFDLGRVDGMTEELLKVKEVLECMCPVKIHRNLMGIRWAKLLINSTFSAVSALTGCSFGQVYDRPESLRLVQHLGNECLRVAKASNVKVEPIQGTDTAAFLTFDTAAGRDKTAGIYEELCVHHRLLRSSMLQDLEKGCKCEIDSINGVVVRMGKKTGVPVPTHEQVVRLIHGIEGGGLVLHPDNVKLIELLAFG
jgi:2-dehydropantoate 2-reductase